MCVRKNILFPQLFCCKSMSSADEFFIFFKDSQTIYKAACVTVHFLTFPKGSIQSDALFSP